MLKRILTSAVGILILIPLCIFSDTIAWPIGVTVLTLFAAYEMLSCIGVWKIKKLSVPSLVFALSPTLFFLLKLAGIEAYKAIFLLLTAYILYMIFVAVTFSEGIEADKFAETVFLISFIVLGFSNFVVLRGFENGGYLLVISFLGAWVSDTFALFGGKFFGKHKLCPVISPKKTVEGSVSGIIFDAIGLVVYGLIINKFCDATANLVKFAVLGVVLSVVSQYGDLLMSRIKRKYDIKDYGSLFPGHGGSLDRFDSVILIGIFMVMLECVGVLGWLFC